MSGDSDRLAAELHDLWVASAFTLPNVAAIYSEASRGINDARRHDEGAFERSLYPDASDETEEMIDYLERQKDRDTSGGHVKIKNRQRSEATIPDSVQDAMSPSTRGVQTMGTVYPQWAQLRDALQTVFALTANNLLETGDALSQVTLGYASRDNEAQERLTTLNDEFLEIEQPPGRVPPPVFPPEPGDEPHYD